MRTHPIFAPGLPQARRVVGVGAWAALGLVAFLPAAASADVASQRGPAGKVLTDTGTLMAREQVDKPWRALEKGQSIPAGDLLLGMPGSALESKNGAVRLSFLSDLDEVSPFPVIETAAILHPSNTFDLDFTLDRGRVDVTNQKDKGSAKVRVRFEKHYWDLTLEQPGTRVALEIYGRWPPGSRYNPDAKQEKGPVINFVLLVLKGKVNRKCPVCEIALEAPAGPALFEWDSVNGQDPSARKLDKLPTWATAPDKESPRAKMKKEKLEKFRKVVVNDSLDAAIKQFLYSDDAYERRLGVYVAAAFDQLNHVADLLNHSKHPDAWHNSVVALRHWLGRGPGQDAILYGRLRKLRDYSPGEAKTTIQLLHGFTELQTAQPELYEVLIDLVRHQRLAIRGLAHWHLQRLAPAVKVDFNPAGDKDEWKKAYLAWKEAIPKGKLPTTLKDNDIRER